MSNYTKGRRREYRTQQILEAAGYETIRAASSKGLADVVAVRPGHVRFVSVKSGSAYASTIEREVLVIWAMALRHTATVEIWRFPDRAREPLIEVL